MLDRQARIDGAARANWPRRSPADSGGASRLPRECCIGRSCCCSTSRAPGSIPARRHDLWRYLRGLRDEDGVTVLVTTHLMEEAEQLRPLGILDHGRLVALDTPQALRATLGRRLRDDAMR